MKTRPCLGATAAVLGWAATAGASADPPATSPTEQKLLDEVNALRGEVKELRARLDAQQPTMRPADMPRAAAPERATSDDLLRDLDRHTALMDMENLTAGYMRGRGFVIKSEDGDFLLHPWAFIQVRNTTNYREFAKNGTQSSTDNGIELPRMKLILDGNIFSTDLTYQFIWATSDTTGNLGLQDAWGRYHLPGTPFAVRAGNIRNPLDHEQFMFATRSMTPDRSIVNNVLLNGDDIVKGASLIYGADTNSPIRTEIAYTSAERNFDTTFQDFPTNPANWGAAGRAEWKLSGDWKDYAQFTALDDRSPLLVLGAGADYTEAGDTADFTHVVDVQFDTPDALSLYAAYLGRSVRHNAGNPASLGGFTGAMPHFNTYDPTVRVMAAYLIAHRWEPFVRYEYLHFDRRELPAAARNDTVHDITAGFNYYWYGHRAKFTAGASYLPNGSPVSSGLGDVLVNNHGNQVVIQAQVQLII